MPYTPTGTVSANSQTVTAPDGTQFNAPGYADFAGVYAYGQQLSNIGFPLDGVGIYMGSGTSGMFDFQRPGGNTFYSTYTYASNYAIGVMLKGAGYSQQQALLLAGLAARGLMGSNARNPAQVSAWTNGWNAAASGACKRTGS